MRKFLILILLVASCAHVKPVATTVESAGEKGWRAWLAGDSAAAERAFAKASADDARALYGRALLLHERGDWVRAWDAWWTLLDAATRAPQKGEAAKWWRAFADSAAHKLEGLAGEVPGERAQAAKLAALDGKRPPPDPRLRLLSMRARYAPPLRHRPEARALEPERGRPRHLCVPRRH